MTVIRHVTSRLRDGTVVPYSETRNLLSYGEVVSHFRITCDRCGASLDYLRDECADAGWLSLIHVKGRNSATGANAYGFAQIYRTALKGHEAVDLCPACASTITAWLFEERDRRERERLAAIEAERARIEAERARLECERIAREKALAEKRARVAQLRAEAERLAQQGDSRAALLAFLERERLVDELAVAS